MLLQSITSFFRNNHCVHEVIHNVLTSHYISPKYSQYKPHTWMRTRINRKTPTSGFTDMTPWLRNSSTRKLAPGRRDLFTVNDTFQLTLTFSRCSHIEAWTKWPPLWADDTLKFIPILLQISRKFIPVGSIDNKSSLVQVIWIWIWWNN